MNDMMRKDCFCAVSKDPCIQCQDACDYPTDLTVMLQKLCWKSFVTALQFAAACIFKRRVQSHYDLVQFMVQEAMQSHPLPGLGLFAARMMAKSSSLHLSPAALDVSSLSPSTRSNWQWRIALEVVPYRRPEAPQLEQSMDFVAQARPVLHCPVLQLVLVTGLIMQLVDQKIIGLTVPNGWIAPRADAAHRLDQKLAMILYAIYATQLQQ